MVGGAPGGVRIAAVAVSYLSYHRAAERRIYGVPRRPGGRLLRARRLLARLRRTVRVPQDSPARPSAFLAWRVVLRHKAAHLLIRSLSTTTYITPPDVRNGIGRFHEKSRISTRALPLSVCARTLAVPGNAPYTSYYKLDEREPDYVVPACTLLQSMDCPGRLQCPTTAHDIKFSPFLCARPLTFLANGPVRAPPPAPLSTGAGIDHPKFAKSPPPSFYRRLGLHLRRVPSRAEPFLVVFRPAYGRPRKLHLPYLLGAGD